VERRTENTESPGFTHRDNDITTMRKGKDRILYAKHLSDVGCHLFSVLSLLQQFSPGHGRPALFFSAP
jgi:hypothetical protein